VIVAAIVAVTIVAVAFIASRTPGPLPVDVSLEVDGKEVAEVTDIRKGTDKQ